MSNERFRWHNSLIKLMWSCAVLVPVSAENNFSNLFVKRKQRKSQLTVTVVWISDNYHHKILRTLSLTFSNNWTINDWLSAAGLIREWRSFESSTMHDLVWYEICSLRTVIWTWFQAFPYIKTLELTSWLKSYFSSDIKRCNRGGALICKYTQISSTAVLIHVY